MIALVRYILTFSVVVLLAKMKVQTGRAKGHFRVALYPSLFRIFPIIARKRVWMESMLVYMREQSGQAQWG